MGISVILYILLSISVGSFLIGLAFNAIEVSILNHYLQIISISEFSFVSTRMLFFLTGFLLILFCIRFIQSSVRKTRRDKTIRFESSQGTVSITLFAIEDMLKKMLEERTEVRNIKPKVYVKKKGIEIIIRGVLAAEVNLVEFTQEIQERIKEKMDTFLGEDKNVKVNLEIRKVLVKGEKEQVHEQEPEVPFRHYD